MALSLQSELDEQTLLECKKVFTERNTFYATMARFERDGWKKFEDWSDTQYLHLDNKSRVVYDICGQTSVPSDRQDRSFQSWLQDVKRVHVDTPYKFRDVHKRLSPNKLGSEGRKNADLREFKNYDCMLMVKKFFTLGFQNLGDECYDLLVTGNKHLDIYLMSPGEVPLERRAFPEFGEDKFTLKRVPPHTMELLTPGTKYILIAPDKCIFYYRRFFEREPLDAVLFGLQTA